VLLARIPAALNWQNPSATAHNPQPLIIPSEGYCAQGALGCRVIDFDAPVISIPRQCFPARERVADGAGELGFLRQRTHRVDEVLIQALQERSSAGLANHLSFLRAVAADLFLDVVEGPDPLERLARDG
jgi:hypothetical protein